MTVKKTQTSVTFGAAFTLSVIEGPQPPGEYRVIVEEDLTELDGLTRQALVPIATYLRTPSVGAPGAAQVSSRLYLVDRRELDAALLRDRGEGI